MEVLIEKTHIRAPYHGKVQKINKLLHIILRNCGLNPPARRFAVLTLYVRNHCADIIDTFHVGISGLREGISGLRESVNLPQT